MARYTNDNPPPSGPAQLELEPELDFIGPPLTSANIAQMNSDMDDTVGAVDRFKSDPHGKMTYRPVAMPFAYFSTYGTACDFIDTDLDLPLAPVVNREILPDGGTAVTSVSDTGEGLHIRFKYPESSPSSPSLSSATQTKGDLGEVSALTAGPVDAKLVHASTPVNNTVLPTVLSFDEKRRISQLRRRTLQKLPSAKKITALNRARTLRSPALSSRQRRTSLPLPSAQSSIPSQVTSEPIAADALTATIPSHEADPKDDGYCSDSSTNAEAGSPPPDPNAFEDWELEYVDGALLAAPHTPCQEEAISEAGNDSSQTARGTKRARDSENDEEDAIRPSRRQRHSLTDTPPTQASTMPCTASLAATITPGQHTGKEKKRARNSEEDVEEVTRPTRRLRSFTGSPGRPTSTDRPLGSPSEMSENSATSSGPPSHSASQRPSSGLCRPTRLMRKAQKGSRKE
ncbi:hypothetical protein B0H34DRAFT_799584 [Crassisporium funariophilum]|nr:hypothetical protein B0H34DRAFT_799584 [Crassisporium funariophilum]